MGHTFTLQLYPITTIISLHLSSRLCRGINGKQQVDIKLEAEHVQTSTSTRPETTITNNRELKMSFMTDD
jgi:hypothetical protein